MDRITQLAIIGAGRIGSRHLQALTLIDRPVGLQVVDPHVGSLENAKKFLSEAKGTENLREVRFLTSLAELNSPPDVAIVATNADIRRRVIEQLLAEQPVPYLILEKFLFQRVEDYAAVNHLLLEKGVRAWCNCGRRMWPFYQDLNARLADATVLECHITGFIEGLGTSAIHLIDLISYLINSSDYELTLVELDQEILSSKRQGFVDFAGALAGRFANGTRFNISESRHYQIPLLVQLISNNLIVNIAEDQGRVWLCEKETAWQWREESFRIPYQSQLTHLAVQQILDTGSCDLPAFEVAAQLHLPLLQSFLGHWRKVQNQESLLCPIT